ncbi:MAG: ribosomal protein S18-alanine N-acetyltransferase [Clostridia bacterium]|nr:ribosomal protein S18-alanine N-acetyltransferase [Clostridia bacterium]
MKSLLNIESISKKDAHCVAKIESECFSTPFKESDILEYIDNPIWHFFVAKDEGKLVGYISFTRILDECQIVNIATTKKARCKGVGTALINALLDFAKKNGVKKLFLEVRESNASAINLYKKFGFLAVGVSKNHYSLPVENAILMNLEL